MTTATAILIVGLIAAADFIVFVLFLDRIAKALESRKPLESRKRSGWSSASPVARCGVPLVGGGFCMEPASPGCCYCDLHSDWPQDRPEGGT